MISATKINTITAAWQKTLAESWGAPAIYSVDGNVLRTFAEIEAEAALMAEKLSIFDEGGVVAIQIGNKPAWPALLLACLRSKLVVLPLGTHIECAEYELALETCRVRGRVGMSGGKLEFDRIEGKRFEWSGERPDLLKLTSGTTSAPRAICFREQQLFADCANICDTMGFGSADINYGVIPFSHSYGFSNLITPLLCRGVPLVCCDDRLPRAIVNGLASSRATVFSGMPVFYQKLAELGDAPALSNLRLCISAGAPLMKDVATAFTQKFSLKIHTFYGASECGGICYDGTDAPEYEDGFVGQPMKNVEITLMERVEDSSRIEVRSGAVGDGYFPEADAETLGGGRFSPSDLVAKTARGLRIVGRVSDVINVAGRKMNPMEIEAQLLKFPGVKQAIVFGVPSPLRQEEAVACVSGTVSAAGLLAHARAVLSAWQVPKDIWLVDEIPANERGKISRRELARQYLAARAT